jgi:hypothetical protein
MSPKSPKPTLKGSIFKRRSISVKPKKIRSDSKTESKDQNNLKMKNK